MVFLSRLFRGLPPRFFFHSSTHLLNPPCCLINAFKFFGCTLIGKGIVKGSDVFIFHIAGDMIAGRHLNDDTGILLQRFWTVRFVISF